MGLAGAPEEVSYVRVLARAPVCACVRRAKTSSVTKKRRVLPHSKTGALCEYLLFD